MPDDADLLDVLHTLRERGALGERSLPQAVDHAAAYLPALSADSERLIDLGSGGGLPALVIAVRRPDLAITMTERRERRADLLRLACSRLHLGERVEVITADVVDLGRDPAFAGMFDAVTARSFGDPLWTARCATPFLRAGGVVVISEPPPNGRDRWPDDELAELGLRRSARRFTSVQCLELTS